MRIARATIHRHGHFLRGCTPFYSLFTALSFPSSSKNRDYLSLAPLSLLFSFYTEYRTPGFLPFLCTRERERRFLCDLSRLFSTSVLMSVQHNVMLYPDGEEFTQGLRILQLLNDESRTIRMCHLPRLCCWRRTRHASIARISLCRRQHYNFTFAFTLGTNPLAARDLLTCWRTCLRNLVYSLDNLQLSFVYLRILDTKG